jgi:putative FmdB family regulatory protein
MPTYEYRCPKGHEFEVVQRITDRTRARCPRCGMVAERQMSGGAGLIFKGSGFYITDYGKDGKGPRKDAEAAPAAPTSTESTAAAATPAAKPEAPPKKTKRAAADPT